MKSAAEGSLVLAKLEDGEDLLGSLEAISREHGIESGTVLWGIGMVRDFEVGYFDGKQYKRTTYGPPHELLALHGSIAMHADPVFHLHIAAGAADHTVVGGHLFRAMVSTMNEVCIAKFERVRLDRLLNPASGLRELVLEPRRSGAGRRTSRGTRGSSPRRRTSARGTR